MNDELIVTLPDDEPEPGQVIKMVLTDAGSAVLVWEDSETRQDKEKPSSSLS